MIGEVIRRIRIDNKLTQKELANQLFVSDKTISSWENDRTIPDIYMLEKISNLYQIQMNDLMKGNVSKFSIFKYRILQLFKKVTAYLAIHRFISAVIIIALLSLPILERLQPLYAYIYMNLIILLSILIFTLKFSRWYFVLFFPTVQILYSDVILFINPAYYGANIDSTFSNRIDMLFGYSSALIFLYLIIYGIYLFINKKQHRFIHACVIGFIAVWTFVVIIYEKSFVVTYRYSSFTQVSSYTVERHDDFWLLTISYILLIIGMLWSHKIIQHWITKNICKTIVSD